MALASRHQTGKVDVVIERSRDYLAGQLPLPVAGSLFLYTSSNRTVLKHVIRELCWHVRPRR